MKKKLLSQCIKIIRDKYPEYDNDKLEIISYGLESIYLTLTKIVVIFGIAILINKFKSVLLLLILYNIIRTTAFGLHAKRSSQCLFISLTLFIGGVYLCDYLYIPLVIKSIIAIVCIILIAKYAPADTEKRPLINKKKRKRFKFISIISSMIFAILIVIFNEEIISNYLLIGLVEATFMILPLSYKIFDLPYDNYKKYRLTEV